MDVDDDPAGDGAGAPDLATVAALVGEPARARMLTALLAGRALTATELSLAGRVVPSTTSSHLGKLIAARLVEVAQQGRHRYFRLAGPPVAAALEGLMAVAPGGAAGAPAGPRNGPRDTGLRRARVCYDHLAGETAVEVLAALRRRGCLRLRRRRGRRDELVLTDAGEAWFGGLGTDVAALRRGRRPLALPCLDWSERRFHLAGALGAALLERLLALRLLRRAPEGRAVSWSARGERFLVELRSPAGAVAP